MRLWRALKQTGCGVLRDGVYLLPSSGTSYEALARLESEIRAAGGFAMTVELGARTAARLAELRKLFDRAGDYGNLVGKIRVAKASLARLGPRRAQTQMLRLGRTLEKLAAIDFYAGEAKAQAEAALADLKGAYRAAYFGAEPRFSRRRPQRFDAARYQKRTWATRKAPWVDRLASAWLIKRFIDRDARFAWIDRPSDCPKNAVGFDFDGAQFTHVGKRVTFEVLLSSFGLETDLALAAIGAA
ncbi:MAG TPA: chromate resistance protein ChrB domain-containing protein, partial [Burkholderiales bacterium]|nr:chromate resistance protein ChrB domain-containing protein [Burkholderiales bacterium]